jgi:DNA-binding Xre family transcriptional regulator
MAVSYNKLWKLLIDKNMNKTDIRDAVGMSPNTLAKMEKNEPVSLDVLVRICHVLHCDIVEVLSEGQ